MITGLFRLVAVKVGTPVSPNTDSGCSLNITQVSLPITLGLACLRLALNDRNDSTIQVKSTDCSLRFTLSLHFTPGAQSAICSPQS